MTYRVVVMRRAVRDVSHIAGWIAERSSAGALSWIAVYESAIVRLMDNPLGYGIANDLDPIGNSILRQFLFKTRRGRTYRGIFLVVDNEVRVLRICGPGQPALTEHELGLDSPG